MKILQNYTFEVFTAYGKSLLVTLLWANSFRHQSSVTFSIIQVSVGAFPLLNHLQPPSDFFYSYKTKHCIFNWVMMFDRVLNTPLHYLQLIITYYWIYHLFFSVILLIFSAAFHFNRAVKRVILYFVLFWKSVSIFCV